MESIKFTGKKYYTITYGCQMNESDTERINGQLEELGYTPANVMDEADIVILNTCSIRQNAEEKVYGKIGEVKKLKEKKDGVLLGIAGCMAQESKKKLIERMPIIDFVIGPYHIHDLKDIVTARNAEGAHVVLTKMNPQRVKDYSELTASRKSNIFAWVPIMQGCNKFCTYCIVPYTRGRQRSRLKEDIIKEVLELKEQGYKEVTLLGQNVNAYGKDLNLSYGMAALLESVAKTNIERIRFVTSHPWDFNDDMLEVISKYENIMPYIHLPLQSGSNKVLKLMGRRYTKEEYLNLVDKIKEKIPNVCLTTDIIVGFPNETDEDFKDTLDVVNYCKYDSAFTFIFSPRIGTPAAKMEDNVSIETKEARLQTLNKLINEYSNMNNKKYLGKTVPVLIEGFSSKNNDMLMGYTDTMKLVNVNGSYEYIGKIVDVKITSTKTWSLNGEICKK